MKEETLHFLSSLCGCEVPEPLEVEAVFFLSSLCGCEVLHVSAI